MAVRKAYECDFCGEDIKDEDLVLVVRAGTLASRPEDAERLDAGPCCWGAGELLLARDAMIMRRAERGQDINGNPLPEEAAHDQARQATAGV